MQEYYNGDSFGEVKQRLKDRSKKTKEKTRQLLSKQAVKIAQRAEEHEPFINKVTHFLRVLGFGAFCFILGASEYLLFHDSSVITQLPNCGWATGYSDFCYYANAIFIIMLLAFPTNERFFMVCFSFAKGPLAWALIVWRCSLVFSSVDKTVSVFIHLLPGLVFFTIQWWDPVFFGAMHPEGTPDRASWPYVENQSYLWKWLFFVPLATYFLWQVLYYLIVEVLCRRRLLRDPEVMTSYRALSKKAKKENNMWRFLSCLLGDQNRLVMFILLQAILTVATTALTVPLFLSYKLHVVYQILNVSASLWNGGNFVLEVMPRQVILKEKKKSKMRDVIEQ